MKDNFLKITIFRSLLIIPFLFLHILVNGQSTQYFPEDKVAAEFLSLLARPAVNPNASFQSFETDSVLIEKGFIHSEENEKIPVVIYKPVSSKIKSFPVVICHHGTGGSKDNQNIKSVLFRLSTMGIMGVAIDARYHGERVTGGGKDAYVEAIKEAWKDTDTARQEHPFFFDTVYDIWRLTDYLITRPDVDPARVGMIGFSMGGIETWLAASIDKRIKVAVPVIAVQSFKWSVENNRWQGRAKTILGAHEEAAKDLGDSTVNKKNVITFWNKVIPGIMDRFDCPSMIRLFAPRPLLLLNTENDPNCPLPGAQLAFEQATNAYRLKNASEKLKIHITPKEGHRTTPEHIEMAIEWFAKWL